MIVIVVLSGLVSVCCQMSKEKVKSILSRLIFRNTSLQGSVPDALGSLSRIGLFDAAMLERDQTHGLSGPLPDSLCSWTLLRWLEVLLGKRKRGRLPFQISAETFAFSGVFLLSGDFLLALPLNLQ